MGRSDTVTLDDLLSFTFVVYNSTKMGSANNAGLKPIFFPIFFKKKLGRDNVETDGLLVSAGARLQGAREALPRGGLGRDVRGCGQHDAAVHGAPQPARDADGGEGQGGFVDHGCGGGDFGCETAR